jgi:hypothetical protein
MKKSLLAASLLAIVSVSAMAGTIDLTTSVSSEQAGGQKFNELTVKPTYNFSKDLSVGVVLIGERNQTDHQTTTKIEPQVTRSFNVFGPVSGSVTVGIGERSSNATSFAYYTVTPAVNYTVTQTVSVKGSLQFRNVFGTTQVPFKGVTETIGVTKNVTVSDVIGVDYFKRDGDFAGHGVILSYVNLF